MRVAFILALTACGPPRIAALAPPPARAAPSAGPALSACWLELSRMDAGGEVGTAGPTRTKRFEGTISALLVRHPGGDVLVDAGSSSRFDEEVASYRGMKRMFLRRGPGSAERVQAPADALRAVGVEPEALRAVVLSHVHVDHAGGLRDLPERVPVWIPAAEQAFVDAHADGRDVGVIREHAARLAGHVEPLDFPDGPYGGWPSSRDVFGDGALVLVPMPGHTPGSVGTFVNLADRSLMHAGDTVLLREGYERLKHKGLLMRHFTDDDVRGVGEQVARLHALHAAEPDTAILPAHDRSAWVAAFGAPGCLPQRR